MTDLPLASHRGGFTIRPDIARALQRYAAERQPLGDFLMAVLRNDLTDAAMRADEYNGASLPAIVLYCANMLPAECWGSPEKVAAWLTK